MCVRLFTIANTIFLLKWLLDVDVATFEHYVISFYICMVIYFPFSTQIGTRVPHLFPTRLCTVRLSTRAFRVRWVLVRAISHSWINPWETCINTRGKEKRSKDWVCMGLELTGERKSKLTEKTNANKLCSKNPKCYWCSDEYSYLLHLVSLEI